MKNANQLASDSAQAYDNFKAVAQNIASANGVIAQLSVAANAAASLGLFEATVSLNGADFASGNAVLFQRLLNEDLTNQGFMVTFSCNINNTSVTVNWDPENQEDI